MKFAQEGCDVAVNYVSSADRAKAVAEKIHSDYGRVAVVVQGVSYFSSTCYFSESGIVMIGFDGTFKFI